ncbi:MAG: hypothetical protein Q8R04_04250 [Nanoarchaeota archaeon]|nr:hypothetical protein [Nanoarchaeota archaeon]
MKKTPQINFKNLTFILLFVFAIISIFAFIDYFAHSLSEKFSVPSYYFRNKVIFGTIIGFIAYLIFRKKGLFARALAFSASVSALLQARYFMEGYPLDFVVLFLFIHFIILLPVSLMVFKMIGKAVK